MTKKPRNIASLIAFPILLGIFVLASCDESEPVGPAGEVFVRIASSETYFSNSTPDPLAASDNTIRIGGVIAVDLEAKNQTLADSVYDSFPEELGIDLVKVRVEQLYTYHFRLEEGLNMDMELIDPFNSTVFRLSPGNLSFSGTLQPGDYGIKFYNNETAEDSVDHRKLLFLQPDTELIESDPLGIVPDIPKGNLAGDHYMVVKESSCTGCDFESGFFKYFIFHHGEGERVKLENVRIKNTDFSYANLNSVDLSGDLATQSKWIYANLVDATISGYMLISHATFERANLNGASMSNIAGKFTNFDYCDLRRFKLTDFSLNNTSMIDCIAFQAEMRNGEMRNTEFTYFKGGSSVMSEVDFTRGDFNSADLVGADLQGSIFDGSDMSESIFANANVAGASFCNIFQYRNFDVKLAVNIGQAECLLDLIERMETD